MNEYNLSYLGKNMLVFADDLDEAKQKGFEFVMWLLRRHYYTKVNVAARQIGRRPEGVIECMKF